ncbi:MAG TPA: lipopolysaccharide kinase InaA family protein [Gemmatimonadaceae bacterium]
MVYRELPPSGFVRFTIDSSEVVCSKHVADAVLEALRAGTLYRYAESHPESRPLAGRGVAYAVPLPGNVERVVVRHNRHGGMLARFTGDLFRAPTMAPFELRTSARLHAAGVPTPIMLGYAIYAAPAGFRRADVMTREIPDSHDLSAAIMADDRSLRARALDATAALVAAMSDAKARHRDLNVKNVLLRNAADGSLEALVLDVDRVAFVDDAADAREANLERLLRSARKWQAIHGARVTQDELDALVSSVRERRPPLASTVS